MSEFTARLPAVRKPGCDESGGSIADPQFTRPGVLQLDIVLSNKVPEGHAWRTLLANGVFVCMH